ncbi:hypothetical protein C8Q74DRAFT_1212926 [Fomes fomentarius]|nr:hypothetical protein C8Q74DRAFT_1212926 [Fomes fomentarius]
MSISEQSSNCGIDSDDGSVPEWADTKIEEYSKRILALKSARNASAPINRKLPPEVLMEVFSQMKPGRYGRQRFHILHVCRLWRHLVFRTSRFWADLLRTSRLSKPNEDQVALLELFFKLSRSQPLSLSLAGLQPAVVSTLLFPHAQYISSLTVSLHALELVQCSCGPCYNAQSKDVDFLGLLEPCAALTALSLKSDGNEQSQTISILPPHNTINLPALQKIEIEILDPQAVSAFLSCLSPPASCFVQSSCYSRTLREQMPAAIDSFPPIIAATSADIYFRQRGRITFRTYANGSKLLRLTVSHSKAIAPSWASHMRDLATVFASSKGLTSITIRTPVDFTLDGEDMKDALQSLLESVPQLSRLDVTGINGKDDVVALLCDSSPADVLPCPLLAELHVQWRYRSHALTGIEAKNEGLRRFCDALVGVLKRRASLGNRLTTLAVDIAPEKQGSLIRVEYEAQQRPLCEAVLAEGGGLQARLGDSVGNVQVAVRFTDVH